GFNKRASRIANSRSVSFFLDGKIVTSSVCSLINSISCLVTESKSPTALYKGKPCSIIIEAPRSAPIQQSILCLYSAKIGMCDFGPFATIATDFITYLLLNFKLYVTWIILSFVLLINLIKVRYNKYIHYVLEG